MNKKIINAVDDVIPQMTEGFIAANSRHYEKVPGVNGVAYKKRRTGKTALVVGGGSGHEPMFAGFVGKGLADAAACGNIFASPDPGTVAETAKFVQNGKGVLFVYGNYAGDNLNFDMAEEILQEEGIETAHVRVRDDCASAPPERTEDRRGIAGDVFVIKTAGAACDKGLSLAEVKRIAEKTCLNLRSIGVGLSPGQIPGAEKPTFTLGDNEMEYGLGLHGEPGVKRTVMRPADELAFVMVSAITEDMPLYSGDEVCVLINGLGCTTIMEMSIVYRKVAQLLGEKGVAIHDADINSYCTCMEMGGFSISILKLDSELKLYYDTACFSPYYAKEGR
ncbi:MAG: dihydroxyacetone kinase subunit DhaK [Clostridiales bacterium]|jgi:dihydroxyacetone kinase|nr:dihydroxyacetone kinase subunit DhaK [Clostridiales bacterium]